MKKNLVFIALDGNEYKDILSIKYPDFAITIVSLDWNRKSIFDWNDTARKQIRDMKVDLLIGFSIGAIVAVILESELMVKKLELVSPSPFFREYIPKFSKTMLKVLGKKRINDIEKISLKKIKTQSKTDVFVGSKELPIMIDIATFVSKQLNCKLNIVTEKDHRNII